MSALHACDGGNQRGQFKPEFLCSEVDKLLAQLQNNLAPLKYSIDLNRIDVLRESLVKLGNLGKAILDSYDEFMRQLDRIATDIQTHAVDPAEGAQYIRH